jgi:hypothetical protein
LLASLGIIVAAGIIMAIEIPGLLKKKWKKELWVFVILMVFSVGVSIAQSLQVKLPNPLDWITAVYQPFTNLVMKWLK